MARGLPRTGFNRSGLIRVLADLGVAEVGEARQSLGERLSQWLDLGDAMAVYSALHGPSTAVATAPAAGDEAGLRGELARVRTWLEEGITVDGVFHPGKARIKLPAPAPRDSAASAADFAPYHRYYLAQQREMQSRIGPLRSRARAALASRSPAGRRLAALDAVMEEALAPRERPLLATIPLLLAKRFEQLQGSHRQELGQAAAADDPARWLEPGGWLAAFCRALRAVLLAEMDFRLEPVAGLVEAFSNEVSKQP